MKKKLEIITLIIILLIFVLIMISGNYLKRPLGDTDNVPKYIEIVVQNVQSEKWEEAGNNTKELRNAWNKVVKRIQFSSERDEINNMTNNIARLKGAIMAKDKALSLVELSEMNDIWDGLNR